MAFAGGVTKAGVREGAGGLWAVRSDTQEFRSWWLWMHVQFDFNAKLQWMTVWDQWPPMTQLRAAVVAQTISDLRDEIDKEWKGRNRPKLVPRHPEPWDGVIPNDSVWASYGWKVSETV